MNRNFALSNVYRVASVIAITSEMGAVEIVLNQSFVQAALSVR